MSVSILAVDDEPDVADLFRRHFRIAAAQLPCLRRSELPSSDW